MILAITISLLTGILIGLLIPKLSGWGKWELVEENVRAKCDVFNVVQGHLGYRSTIINRYMKKNSRTGKVKFKSVEVY